MMTQGFYANKLAKERVQLVDKLKSTPFVNMHGNLMRADQV